MTASRNFTMVTSWRRNFFLIIDHLRGKYTARQWIPLAKGCLSGFVEQIVECDMIVM